MGTANQFDGVELSQRFGNLSGVEQAFAAVVVVTGLVFGCGAAGVAIAWLKDRREHAIAKRSPKLDPRHILEARFAAGEIDEAEFNRRMNRLMLGPTLELD
jgi:uncharacterized membrane protein